MITKEELLAMKHEKIVDILLKLYETNRDVRHQLDIMFTGLNEGVINMVCMIRRQISSIEHSERFIGYYETDGFAEDLDEVRVSIGTYLLDQSPAYALELMLEFIGLHDGIIERTQDDSGVISRVFQDACNDMIEICRQLNKPIDELVDLVFKLLLHGDREIYYDIITDFKDLLQDEGLKKLQNKLIKEINLDNSYRLEWALKNIADCQKDIDAYIRACSFVRELTDRDYINIAERFVDQDHPKEALKWLGKIDINSHYEYKYRRLKIKALELNGDQEEAQHERLKWFEENLSHELYKEILAHMKPELKEAFRVQTVEKAFQFKSPDGALGFLIEIKALEEAAKFLRLNIDQLHSTPSTLIQAASNLFTIDPLAATLAYRKLINPILDATKSKYYSEIARYLVACTRLSPKISDWGTYQSHQAYFNDLGEKHKRKFRFWEEYKLALNPPAIKEIE